MGGISRMSHWRTHRYPSVVTVRWNTPDHGYHLDGDVPCSTASMACHIWEPMQQLDRYHLASPGWAYPSKSISGQESVFGASKPRCTATTRHQPGKSQCPTGGLRSSMWTFLGHCPPHGGTPNLLTIVDRFTRWPKAIPTMTTDTTAAARALISHWWRTSGQQAWQHTNWRRHRNSWKTWRIPSLSSSGTTATGPPFQTSTKVPMRSSQEGENISGSEWVTTRTWYRLTISNWPMYQMTPSLLSPKRGSGQKRVRHHHPRCHLQQKPDPYPPDQQTPRRDHVQVRFYDHQTDMGEMLGGHVAGGFARPRVEQHLATLKSTWFWGARFCFLRCLLLVLFLVLILIL